MTAMPLLQPSAFVQPANEMEALEADALALFLEEDSGHMGVWEYAAAAYKGDPAGGGAQWTSLVQNPGAYYPVDAEVYTVHNALKEKRIYECFSNVRSIIELGTCSEDSIIKKTFPFLRKCSYFNEYIAIDATVELASTAASLVKSHFSCNTVAVDYDYINTAFIKSSNVPSAVIMWGNSLGNISGRKGENVLPKLVSRLKNFRASLEEGDLFVVCFDTEDDENKVLSAYKESLLSQSILSVLHRLKRDGCCDGNFDPWLWRHEPEWIKETRQCAHMIFPIIDQQISIAGCSVFISAGKRFVSNNSYKFSPETVAEASKKAGFSPVFCYKRGPMAMFCVQA